MGQDIRDMMKGSEPKGAQLSKGHEIHFEEKLKQNFSTGLLQDEHGEEKNKKTLFFWLKIAAAIIVFLGVGYFAFEQWNGGGATQPILAKDTVEETTTPQITLGDLSPDLQRVEEFYTTVINVQLSSLQNDSENKELIDGYMKRLEELDKEYKKLINELNEVGPTEATITALIDNLKLRLELLFKLKNKLKELKQLENEQFSNSTV